MTVPHSAASTLTIEYVDGDGQVQRVEQLQGSHFTLRVSGDAPIVQLAPAAAPLAAQVLAAGLASQGTWERISPWLRALILFGIYALITALETWIEHNPDSTSRNYVTMGLGITAALALWSAVWALLGKIFAKHALYWQHVSIVLTAGIVLAFVMYGMHFLSFSLSWRVLGRIDNLTLLTAFVLLAWAHLRLIVPPARIDHLRWGVLTLLVLSVALLMWTNQRRQGTVFDTLHSAHLYRSALQFTSANPSDDFFNKARALEAPLKVKAAESEPGEDGVGADDD